MNSNFFGPARTIPGVTNSVDISVDTSHSKVKKLVVNGLKNGCLKKPYTPSNFGDLVNSGNGKRVDDMVWENENIPENGGEEESILQQFPNSVLAILDAETESLIKKNQSVYEDNGYTK